MQKRLSNQRRQPKRECCRRPYNIAMANPVPPAIRGQKYISLITFRKNGRSGADAGMVR